MADRRGRPSTRVIVSPSERATLDQWIRRRSTAQGLALRARIVLACTSDRTDVDVASDPRRITDTMVERVITDTLESTPRDATHWSTRSMAKAAGLSQSAVARIWKAFALQPHRVETFKLSKDPL